MPNDPDDRMPAAPASQQREEREIDPRQPQRRVLLSSALAASMLSLLPLEMRQVAHAADAQSVLSAELLAILDAFADRIIPADQNGPGARAAGAAIYIDRSLGDWNAGELETLSAGLRALDALARRRFSSGFPTLPDAQKDELLTVMEAGQAADFANAQQIFNRLHRLTLEGTFSDPYYGGNRNFIGWDLIGYPGATLVSTPEMQRMGSRLAPLHSSAYPLKHEHDGY
ncbi:MAG TPA: gluconate 2-dehydrogenase subunit 3 family protein [Steroidobacteraceae bacterium]|jgi:gluconate 2-dehydrogenase gamma chain